MDKVFITTMNKKLFDNFGKDLLVSYKNSNQKYPMYVYVEDDIKRYPIMNNITYINLYEEEPECEKFVERNKDKHIPSFMFDGVRFNYKVFAQCNSIKFDCKVYYIDADSIFLKCMTRDVLDTILPDDICTSFYYRKGLYTETGFIGFNFNHDIMVDFIEYYKNLYISDTVYNLPHYTDCHTYDKTRETFKDDERYSEKKLGDGAKGHIMARCKLIGPFIDHRKGKRKRHKHSPEWVWSNHG